MTDAEPSAGQDHGQSTDPRTPEPTAGPERHEPERTAGRLVLCPYCGHTQTNPVRCEACRGLFEPLSRKATQISMGPWFIRDPANPFRPGCSYETLKRLVETGRVDAHTIIRGPTTRQFWSVARNVPGVAHLVGSCHQCRASVQPTATRCPSCGQPFGGMSRRNELGLAYPTPEAAAHAQRELDQQRQLATGGSGDPAAPPAGTATGTGAGTDMPAAAAQPTSSTTGASGPAANDDLLEQVLQSGQSAHAGGSAPDSPPHAGPSQTTDPPVSSGGATALEPGPPPEPATRDAPGESTTRSSAIVWLVVLINALLATLAVLAAWHFLV